MVDEILFPERQFSDPAPATYDIMSRGQTKKEYGRVAPQFAQQRRSRWEAALSLDGVANPLCDSAAAGHTAAVVMLSACGPTCPLRSLASPPDASRDWSGGHPD